MLACMSDAVNPTVTSVASRTVWGCQAVASMQINCGHCFKQALLQGEYITVSCVLYHHDGATVNPLNICTLPTPFVECV